MCFNNGNNDRSCLWLIMILILLWCCCGSSWGGIGQGNCGCGNNCNDTCC